MVKIFQCSGQSSAANSLCKVLLWPSCKLASMKHLYDMNCSNTRSNVPEEYCLEKLTQNVQVFSASQTQLKCHVAQAQGLFYFSHLNSMTACDVAAIPAAARVNLPDDTPLICHPRTNKSISGDSLHRFTENFALTKGTLVQLAVQNFTSLHFTSFHFTLIFLWENYALDRNTIATLQSDLGCPSPECKVW